MREEKDTLHLIIVRWNENLTWVRDFFPDTNTTIIQKASDPVLDLHLKHKLETKKVGETIEHQELTLDDSFYQQQHQHEQQYQQQQKKSHLHLHLHHPHFQQQLQQRQEERQQQQQQQQHQQIHNGVGDMPYLDGLSRVEFDFISNTQGLGRECSGYLWWILEHYDNLPTWSMFVHGAPEKSATIARTYLTEPRGHFQSFAGNIVNRCFEKYNGEEGRVGGEFFLQEWEDLMKDLNLPVPHCIRNFCCANFVVHHSRIRLLPKESWKKLLLYVLLPAKGPGWRNNCYHLEHFWHILMGEPSHTYIGFTPHPDSSASRIVTDSPEKKSMWENEYRPYMKPGAHKKPNN